MGVFPNTQQLLVGTSAPSYIDLLPNKHVWIDPTDPSSYSVDGDGDYLTLDDKTGNGFDLTTSSGGVPPITIGGNKLIDIDSTFNHLLNFNNTGTSGTLPAGDLGFNDTDPFTIFIILKTTCLAPILGRANGDLFALFSIAEGKFTYEHYNGGWLKAQSTTLVNDDVLHVIGYTNYSDGTCDIWVDGVKELSGANAGISHSKILKLDRIGNSTKHFATGNYYDGQVGELLILNAVNSDTVNTEISNYYIDKYGI